MKSPQETSHRNDGFSVPPMQPCTSPRQGICRRALGYFRPDLSRVLALLGLIGAATVLGLLQVWPLAILVDSVLSRTPQSGWMYQHLIAPWTRSLLGQVVLLAGATLALRLIQEVLNLLRAMINLQINNNGLLRVRCDLFQKLQALHVNFHRTQPQGDTIYRLSNDAQGVPQILGTFIDVGVAALTLAVMLVILLGQSLELTLMAMSIAPLLFLTNVWFAKLLKSSSLDAKEVESRFTAVLQRSITSINLVQAYRREPVEFGRFRDSVAGTNQAWYQFHWKSALYRLCVGVLFAAGGAMIFAYGGYLVYRDQVLRPSPEGMTVGDLMVFLTYLGMFYDPLCRLSGAGASVQTAVASAERVFDVLDRELAVADAPEARSLPQQPRALALKNVSFGYGEGPPVLQRVQVTIQPGQMVAFVGASGVGKSTLLNLLPRFYDPTEGALTLDGHDLRKIKLHDLRQHIAVVMQESTLLPTTIAENIAYGRLDASEADIRHAAQMAGAAAFIEALPDGYNTVVAEGGQNLSGGQRQRIAIARALVTEAPILVLDEPTSALDPYHERQIADLLASLKGKRTIILVSHRLSTVVDCDQIFVLDRGHVVERGSHRRLLKRRRVYFEMAKQQLQLEDPPSARPSQAA